jgi:YVTN family beta-propeller protein
MRWFSRLALSCAWLSLCAAAVAAPVERQAVPTGQLISPLAVPGAVFQALNPDLADLPAFTVDHAASEALSPDGRTLLILTSGFNRNVAADGKNIPALSNEYVFIYDVSGAAPRKRQVVEIPDSFLGLAWAPAGDRFFVAGGVDDDVVEFAAGADGRFQPGRTFKLGHKAGVGARVPPSSAGLAVSPDGQRLLVANLQNDSVSLIDLGAGQVAAELDLRPGKIDPRDVGKPGGTFPRAVIWNTSTHAWVGALRDRELIEVAVEDGKLHLVRRVATKGQPNALAIGANGRRLYVAEDNTDRLVTIDRRTAASWKPFRRPRPRRCRQGPVISGAPAPTPSPSRQTAAPSISATPAKTPSRPCASRRSPAARPAPGAPAWPASSRPAGIQPRCRPPPTAGRSSSPTPRATPARTSGPADPSFQPAAR